MKFNKEEYENIKNPGTIEFHSSGCDRRRTDDREHRDVGSEAC